MRVSILVRNLGKRLDRKNLIFQIFFRKREKISNLFLFKILIIFQPRLNLKTILNILQKMTPFKIACFSNFLLIFQNPSFNSSINNSLIFPQNILQRLNLLVLQIHLFYQVPLGLQLLLLVLTNLFKLKKIFLQSFKISKTLNLFDFLPQILILIFLLVIDREQLVNLLLELLGLGFQLLLQTLDKLLTLTIKLIWQANCVLELKISQFSIFDQALSFEQFLLQLNILFIYRN